MSGNEFDVLTHEADWSESRRARDLSTKSERWIGSQVVDADEVPSRDEIGGAA